MSRGVFAYGKGAGGGQSQRSQLVFHQFATRGPQADAETSGEVYHGEAETPAAGGRLAGSQSAPSAFQSACPA